MNWKWLRKQNHIKEIGAVKHIKLSSQISSKIDGQNKLGIITKQIS